jgi:hypothetical protein
MQRAVAAPRRSVLPRVMRQAWRSESRSSRAMAGITSESRGRTSRPMAIVAAVAAVLSSVIPVKLYIYGYLNRVQSSRRLEREAGRNLEVMWLLGRLVPDHKTIADFRKDNGDGIKKVCARFVELCRRMGLLSTASLAIDGSKFKSREQPGQEFHEREN